MRFHRRLAILVFPLLAVSVVSADSRMTAADVIARHLESLGTPEARSNVTSRSAEGIVRMRVTVGSVGEIPGRAFLFGEPTRVRIAMPFGFSDYFGENFLEDADKIDVGFSQPTQRSPLGEFLRNYTAPLSEGLLAGVLSTRWPLLNVNERQPRLDYRGLKKVDGRQLHLMSYASKKGRDRMNMDLYFDPVTFRHVRSYYLVTVASPVGRTIESSSSQQERRFSIEETFGDFQAFGGLTLPTHWKIRCVIDGERSDEREWDVTFKTITHNASIDPAEFVLAAPKRR